MFIDPNTKAYDGDYEIIFSDTFNVYENTLRLTNIGGYEFNFVFDKNEFIAGEGSISARGDDVAKKITVNIKSFRNSLGAGSTSKLPVINLKDGRQIFLTVYGKSLSKEMDFLHVTVNFYLK